MKKFILFIAALSIIGGSLSATEYYSRMSGNWNDTLCWSTENFNGPPASTFPNTLSDIAFIGGEREITLDANRAVGTVEVQLGGTLIFGVRVLTGNEFKITFGGKVNIGHPDGITNFGASGNVQSTQRSYNDAGHNMGHYVFSGACTNTGNGFPDAIGSLEVALNAGGTLLLDHSIEINDYVKIQSGIFSANNHDISLKGNWTNNAEFLSTNSIVSMNGTLNQEIGGSGDLTFYNLTIQKSTGKVIALKDMLINGNLNLIFNNILDISTHTLTIGENGNIYSDNTQGQTFSQNKCILTGTNGKLIRNIPNGAIIPYTLLFPMATSETAYTPVKLVFGNGTTLNGATLSVKITTAQHPNVINGNLSLTRYWTLETSGTLLPGPSGTELEFNYTDADVKGGEGNYKILRYASGEWTIEPGESSNVVAVASNKFTAVKVTGSFAGDWTAGELTAVRKVYYSRMTGNYGTPATWSQISHTGAASSYAPGSANDMVIIGENHVVTLTSNTPAANEVIVENTGALMTGEFVVTNAVKTFKLQSGGTLGIGNPTGISPTEMKGNIQALSRSFSQGANYIFTSIGNQLSGDALPTKVACLKINKANDESTVTLSHSVAVSDSLVIYKGILDQTIDLFSFDGDSPGRKFIMHGGKVKLFSHFPDNYIAPEFTAGEVEFSGVDALLLPGGASDNPVRQYNNLTLSGNRGPNAITFDDKDSIKIYGKFQINNLEFSPATGDRFITQGSTVVFNGMVGQQIPRRCKTDSSWMRLNYYNLYIACKDTASLIDTNHIILNDLTIANGSLLKQNGNGIEIQGDWVNNGGAFLNDGKSRVIFNSLVKDSVKTIKSGDWPFYVITVAGPGAYMFIDNMSVDNGVSINKNATFKGEDDTLTVRGNWIDNGKFLFGQSTVSFAGAAEQNIFHPENETFYNLDINNPAGVQFYDTQGAYITVKNNLNFSQGVLHANTNNRFISVDSSVTRTGTGHVNGKLRLRAPAGASTKPLLFPVGTNVVYRAMSAVFSGEGGTPGYLMAYSEPATEDFFKLHSGCGLLWNKSVQKRWALDWASGAVGALGQRTFNLTLFFDESDPTVSADPLLFEIRRHKDSAWHKPITGSRTDLSVESLNNDGFGLFITGQSAETGFFSINHGPWSSPASWSTEGYDGAPAASAPSSTANIKIGGGKKITLDNNFVINSGYAVTVESNGHLDCGENNISGNGKFILGSDAILEIGSPDGITTSGQKGNIQAFERDFNQGGHNKGTFIYSGTAEQVTGNGIPDVVFEFIAASGGNLKLSKSIAITGDLQIESGALDVSENNYNITIGGHWTNLAEFNEGGGNATVTFNGTANQNIERNGEEKFNILKINKASGQVIPTNNNVSVEKELSLEAGVIDARTGSRSINVGANGTANSGGGFVDGMLSRTVKAGAASDLLFPVGLGPDYTPANLSLSGSDGTEGKLSVTAYGAAHPNINTSKIDNEKNILRYWKISPDASFAMGTRQGSLNLSYLSSDIRGGADPLEFIMQRYSGNAWTDISKGANTLTSSQGTGIDNLAGDFAVGLQKGQAVDETLLGDNSYCRFIPNPAVDFARFEFELNSDSYVNITVYDITGRKLLVLADEFMFAGKRAIDWNIDLESGFYYYILKSGDIEVTRKIIVSR